jgi:hypothetical protein
MYSNVIPVTDSATTTFLSMRTQEMRQYEHMELSKYRMYICKIYLPYGKIHSRFKLTVVEALGCFQIRKLMIIEDADSLTAHECKAKFRYYGVATLEDFHPVLIRKHEAW